MVLGLPVNIFIITSDNICEDIDVLFENLKQPSKSLLSYFEIWGGQTISYDGRAPTNNI